MDSAIQGAQATALGANGVTDLTSLNGIKAALDKGFNPLANKRVSYRPYSSLPTAQQYHRLLEYKTPFSLIILPFPI
jgi:hypothetical protein